MCVRVHVQVGVHESLPMQLAAGVRAMHEEFGGVGGGVTEAVSD